MAKSKLLAYPRKIDCIGRVTIPKSIRDNLKIMTDDTIEIYEKDGGIAIRKYIPENCCAICGKKNNVQKLDNGLICTDCINEVLGRYK